MQGSTSLTTSQERVLEADIFGDSQKEEEVDVDTPLKSSTKSLSQNADEEELIISDENAPVFVKQIQMKVETSLEEIQRAMQQRMSKSEKSYKI
jgi:hypothetical protein